eukprot:scaffold17888_cov149-Isochrysis_galbana.AAC.2
MHSATNSDSAVALGGMGHEVANGLHREFTGFGSQALGTRSARNLAWKLKPFALGRELWARPLAWMARSSGGDEVLAHTEEVPRKTSARADATSDTDDTSRARRRSSAGARPRRACFPSAASNPSIPQAPRRFTVRQSAPVRLPPDVRTRTARSSTGSRVDVYFRIGVFRRSSLPSALLLPPLQGCRGLFLGGVLCRCVCVIRHTLPRGNLKTTYDRMTFDVLPGAFRLPSRLHAHVEPITYVSICPYIP